MPEEKEHCVITRELAEDLLKYLEGIGGQATFAHSLVERLEAELASWDKS